MKVIKVDHNSYFYNKVTGKPIIKFDPNDKDIEFKYSKDGYVIHVSRQNIKCGKPLGIYFIDPSGDTIAIDDGFQQELIYSAYLINGVYDQIQEKDHDKGLKARYNICYLINDAIQEYINSKNELVLSDTFEKINNNIICKFSTPEGVTGAIEFKTISNIVNQNKFRREYGLQYYPYLKYMDKYNSYHLNIFVDNTGKEWRGSTITFDKFVDDFLNIINNNQDEYQFHIKVMPIKQRIIRWNSYYIQDEKKSLDNLYK